MDKALACPERFQCRAIAAPAFGQMTAGSALLLSNLMIADQAAISAGLDFRREAT
jgi:hypothetical protein